MKKVNFIFMLFSMFVLANGESNDVRLSRKHASDFLGITNDTEPPYDIFNGLTKNTDRYREFAGILMSFSSTNDIEDVVGISYIGKFYRYYCPNPMTKNFNELSLLEQMAVKELFEFPQKIFLEAKKLSNCSYPEE